MNQILQHIRQVFETENQVESKQEPEYECNYDNDYFGDQVCQLKVDDCIEKPAKS
ncbi:hypothetical protein [Paraferrimonas sedimenticola]|uniref:Uncharacterized protein n=1 Tax=Paraferrimonas sedimenticola TaxID=375674 RepID=A0AA37RYJ7_9GAMM|nr:hypothetical protein [Paraferrimonas sedimenticola]GLP97800.1 hypothetical protein GCM10007895_31070 [Paraferrimonas sedimenticola]